MKQATSQLKHGTDQGFEVKMFDMKVLKYSKMVKFGFIAKGYD